MKRISAKMKLLSLAILGLGGMALAGSAAAACPTSTVPPWTSQSTLGGNLAISDGGLDSSACKLDAKITVNGPGSAFVRDNSPASEPTYRAQFKVNVDALGAVNSIQSFKVFGASTDTPALSIGDLVKVAVQGNLAGTASFLNVRTVCEGESGNLCVWTKQLAAGTNTVEIQWVKGNPGVFKVWLNNSTENSPDLSLTPNSATWAGVDYATLGIANPSPGYRAAHLNQIVSVDSFDSRRTTFIGN